MNLPRIFISVLAVLVVVLIACTPDPDPSPINPNPDPDPVDTTQTEALTFLALGDSYTIGESVETTLRWPVQLKDSLVSQGIDIGNPTIIARTGWTTAELQQGIINRSGLDDTYDLVSLLIGVNNQFRGYDFNIYEKEFVELLGTALNFAEGNADRVIVLSIPDYGATPFGASRDTDKIARELDAYNAFAKAEAEKLGISFFDITPISREGENDRSLVAIDGLHPSGLMYARWVELIREEVQGKLEE